MIFRSASPHVGWQFLKEWQEQLLIQKEERDLPRFFVYTSNVDAHSHKVIHLHRSLRLFSLRLDFHQIKSMSFMAAVKSGNAQRVQAVEVIVGKSLKILDSRLILQPCGHHPQRMLIISFHLTMSPNNTTTTTVKATTLNVTNVAGMHVPAFRCGKISNTSRMKNQGRIMKNGRLR